MALIVLTAAAGKVHAQSTVDTSAQSNAPPSKETPQELGKIKVEATDESETAGSYTASDLTVGGKVARDLRQIQQSVSVVTQQRIQDQNLQNVTDALTQTTGITVATTNYQSIFSRGFEIKSLQFDGGSPALINNYGDYSGLPDLATYDRVEVLRGADGLFSGAGEAGGTVNLVRKRPLSYAQLLVDVTAGRWDNYRAQLDATGPLAWDGKLRGRVVAAQGNRHYFYDTVQSDKTVLFGSLEADLTSRTLLTIGGSFERNDSVPNLYGLPRYSTGGDLGLSRNTCLCADWSYWNTDTEEIFTKLEQGLSERWTLKLNVSQQRRPMEIKFAAAYGSVSPDLATRPVLSSTEIDFAPRQRLADATLSGDFTFLGRKQELVVGANWQEVDAGNYYQSFFDTSSTVVDVFNFDPAAFPEPQSTPYWEYTYPRFGQKQHGVYASLRSQITNSLHSVVGVRNSNFLYNRTENIFNSNTGEPLSTTVVRAEDSNVVTPYAGLSYDLNETITAYGSFAEIFQPQAAYVTASGEPLDPITGRSFEIGAKGAWHDNAVNASLAAYFIQRTGEAVRTNADVSFGDLFCCYGAAGEIESKGIDAELTGRLLPGWEVFTGYTYNLNEQNSGYGDQDGAAFFPQTPRHLFKLWTMVQLPNGLSDWRFGAGLNAQSRTSVKDTAASADGSARVPFEYSQGGYAIVGLRGEYRFIEGWSAAINISNLFDRTYYQTVGKAPALNFYGEPRNVMLSLTGSW